MIRRHSGISNGDSQGTWPWQAHCMLLCNAVSVRTFQSSHLPAFPVCSSLCAVPGQLLVQLLCSCCAVADAVPVCSSHVQFRYAVPVCRSCVWFLWAVPACSLCVQCLWAAPVCNACLQFLHDFLRQPAMRWSIADGVLETARNM